MSLVSFVIQKCPQDQRDSYLEALQKNSFDGLDFCEDAPLRYAGNAQQKGAQQIFQKAVENSSLETWRQLESQEQRLKRAVLVNLPYAFMKGINNVVFIAFVVAMVAFGAYGIISLAESSASTLIFGSKTAEAINSSVWSFVAVLIFLEEVIRGRIWFGYEIVALMDKVRDQIRSFALKIQRFIDTQTDRLDQFLLNKVREQFLFEVSQIKEQR